MDKARMAKKRWRKELKRRRLKKQHATYMAIKGHTESSWTDLRKSWADKKAKLKSERKKKLAKV
jgi:hypothetical protein